MRPDEEDAARIWDMLQAAERVVALVRGHTVDEYVADILLKSAIERQVQIIGEAARHVSQAFQASYPQIPWRPIIVQRHILVHEYAVVDDIRIWRVATIHVPALAEQLKTLFPDL